MNESTLNVQDLGEIASPTDSPEYIESMIKKADEGTNTRKQDTLFAGKYKSEEDLSKGILEALKAKHGGNLEQAYKSLAGDLGKDSGTNKADEDNQDDSGDSGSAKDESDTPDGSDTGDNPNDDKNDSGNVDASELMDTATIEYSESGELSPETYEKLQKTFNVDKALIDNYIAGQQAQADLAAHQVYGMVGGQEAFESMKSWAATNMSKEQIMMFNDDIISGDIAKISRAVEMCNTAYRKANGSRGANYLDSTKNNSNNSGGYGSLAEWKRDLADPKYSSGDTAFQAHVMNRLKHTTSF